MVVFSHLQGNLIPRHHIWLQLELKENTKKTSDIANIKMNKQTKNQWRLQD